MNAHEPIFPVGGNGECEPAIGLTKREWIATRLMGAILSQRVQKIVQDGEGVLPAQSVQEIAKTACSCADILLKELEKL